ncbi:MAG: class I SAM-dependent methyltransferase, partial [Terriglobia bacterium]
RHEETGYISAILKIQLLSYFEPATFSRKRFLDFGCGTGASTIALAKLLPETEIVGVELDSRLVDLGNKIAVHQQAVNARLVSSPSPGRLPEDVGKFDFVMLCAVYEHLLPGERRTLMPQLWSLMKTGGVLFINQTPHRWFPFEHHSTGLWLVNYLPDTVAHWIAKRYARHNPRFNRSAEWAEHLRGGIRGGTEREIIKRLCPDKNGSATILQPTQHGLKDRADYWLACTNTNRYRLLKKLISESFRLCDRYLGTIPSINVDVAIHKESSISQ